MSGKAQGTLNEQYIRKTIVSIHATFPYIVKRSLITDKQEVVLKPIENAIEGMVKRIEKFEEELENDPPNLKSLQSLLQGSVLACTIEP
jgi:hypothetical protein